MAEAYIVEAVRTPVGRRKGGLSGVHPADLGAHVLRALVERSGVDPSAVEDVVFGCLDTVGPQAGDIARTAWLAAGLPEEVPGVTIDRQCGSSQQAVHFAAQGVLSGTQDLVVAGGVQNMTQIPIAFASRQAAEPLGLTQGPFALQRGLAGPVRRPARQPVPRRAVDRPEVGDLAPRHGGVRAHLPPAGDPGHRRRPLRAGARGVRRGHRRRGPRRDTTLEKMAALKPVLEGGTITAACSSQVSDGAAALLIASERAVAEHGLRPRARIHHLSVRGEDPIRMLSAPIPATAYALKKTGMSIDDIDLVEINEAFAPVVLAWLKETGADPGKVNVNGGAIALGHPLGATGVKLMTTLLHELERTGGRYGLQTMCEGGGQANVTIIERL